MDFYNDPTSPPPLDSSEVYGPFSSKESKESNEFKESDQRNKTIYISEQDFIQSKVSRVLLKKKKKKKNMRSVTTHPEKTDFTPQTVSYSQQEKPASLSSSHIMLVDQKPVKQRSKSPNFKVHTHTCTKRHKGHVKHDGPKNENQSEDSGSISYMSESGSSDSEEKKEKNLLSKIVSNGGLPQLNFFSKEALRKKRIKNTFEDRQCGETNLNTRQKHKKKTLQTQKTNSFTKSQTDSFEESIAHRFGYYQKNFKNLSKCIKFQTQLEVISIVITDNESLALVLLRENPREVVARIHDLENKFDQKKEALQEIHIHGETFLQAQEIVYNGKGDIFCLPYYDSGKYMIRVFSLDNKTIDLVSDLNERLGISLKQKCLPSFNFPSITAEFCGGENSLFVNLFDGRKSNNWHFIYNYRSKVFSISPQSSKIPCSRKNFILQCLTDHERGMHHVIYRHGQCVTIKLAGEHNHHGDKQDQDEKAIVEVQQICKTGIGHAHLIQSKCLTIRHSNQILFFKRELSTAKQKEDCHHHEYEWINYHKIDEVLQIHNNLGSSELIVTTNKKIYLYEIEEDTFMPKLKSVILNFLDCSNFIEGLNKEIYITYTVGQEDFIIHRRKQNHSFRIPIEKEKRAISHSLEIKKASSYCISDVNTIRFYKQDDFQTYLQIIEVFKNQKDQEEEEETKRILKMKISPKDNVLVVFVGYLSESQVSQVSSIYIYDLVYNLKELEEVRKRYKRALKQELWEISCEFEFYNTEGEEDQIFLIDESEIYLYNYNQETIQEIFSFPKTHDLILQRQPEIFVLNSDQTVAFVKADNDTVFINLGNNQKLELDEVYGLSDIKACLNIFGKFYILANKRIKNKGVYLFQIDENEFLKKQEENECFLIKWEHKLDIDDVDLYCLDGRKRETSFKLGVDMFKSKFQEVFNLIQDTTKELILSFKSIFQNTYSIFVMDLPSKKFIFKHQIFHLWESDIKGLFLQKSNLFLTISEQGVFAQSLSRVTNQVSFKDLNLGSLRTLHSLQMCDHLKINKSNHIFFRDVPLQNVIEINIQEQYNHNRYNDTKFEDIYTILIQEMSLWEIFLIQGVFCCTSQDDMSNLIEIMPDTSVFFKSFLELDLANFVTILSFDSRCIKALLTKKNIENIDHRYPIFYRICQWVDPSSRKVDIKTAVDIALQNNQVQALNQIISYVVQFQNRFVFSFLFQKNFKFLLEKGIYMKDLLGSNIFSHQFHYEDAEWPQTHTNPSQMIAPFNNSIFDIRKSYSTVFEALALDLHHQQQARQDQNHAIFKIKYTINLLPSMDIDDGLSLMDLLGDTNQIDILKTKAVQDIINFKWNAYGKKIHYLSAIMHMIYVTMFLLFLNYHYLLRNSSGNKNLVMLFMLICNTYSFVYDTRQLIRQGFFYFFDPWNYYDQMYIWSGYMNIFYHLRNLDQNVFDQTSQLTMIFFTIMMLVKTFFFLRIFERFTKLVIMIKNVVNDLKEFIAFYILLLTMFSVVLGVLGVGNYENTQNEALSDLIQQSKNDPQNMEEYPGFEYKNVNEFAKNVLIILRFSLGDFDFGATNHLNDFERTVFWITWVIIVLMTCVVFLNFIIAEVSESYQTVNINVNEYILQEKAKMINESEDMMFSSMRENTNLFPQYIILREVEE